MSRGPRRQGPRNHPHEIGGIGGVLYHTRGEPRRGGRHLALDVHKGQRLPWVDHHRVRPRRARASELAPVQALDRDGPLTTATSVAGNLAGSAAGNFLDELPPVKATEWSIVRSAHLQAVTKK